MVTSIGTEQNRLQIPWSPTCHVAAFSEWRVKQAYTSSKSIFNIASYQVLPSTELVVSLIPDSRSRELLAVWDTSKRDQV